MRCGSSSLTDQDSLRPKGFRPVPDRVPKSSILSVLLNDWSKRGPRVYLVFTSSLLVVRFVRASFGSLVGQRPPSLVLNSWTLVPLLPPVLVTSILSLYVRSDRVLSVLLTIIPLADRTPSEYLPVLPTESPTVVPTTTVVLTGALTRGALRGVRGT